MGMPAARIGDLTAHGGTILMGLPTVLIGGMPAARMSDACLPHGHGDRTARGGPDPSTLCDHYTHWGLPAARVTDTAVCVGPRISLCWAALLC